MVAFGSHFLRKFLGGVLVASLALGTLGASPGLALAQDSTARAREQFRQALELEGKGSFAEALARFQEVAVVKKTPPVLFHVGFCQEHLGQWFEALATYKEGIQLADTMPSDPKAIEARHAIEQALSDLEKRFASLTLTRGRGARNATISLDGKNLDNIQAPIRLLPGKHLIQAKARGKENFRSEIVLVDGQKMTIEIALESLENDPDPPPKSDPPPRASAPAAKAPAPASERSVAPLVVLGIGGASLAASGVFYLLRNSAQKDLESQCVGIVCPASARAYGDRAQSMNTATNVTVGVGAVGVGVGLIWLLATSTSDSPKPQKSSLQVVPSIDARSIQITGAF